MNKNGVITIGRQDLYERVWATPMRTLAAEFGVSNVGLAKACERHRIPCPPRGYWAKKQHGKPTRRLSLPPCPDPALQTVTIHPPAPKPPEASNPTEPPLDPDLAAVLESVRKLPELRVPSALRHPHPLVEAVRTRFQGRGHAGPAEFGPPGLGRDAHADRGRRGGEGAAGVAVPRRSRQGGRAGRRACGR